jgi:putative spermidine/putrescine transport system permease protein
MKFLSPSRIRPYALIGPALLLFVVFFVTPLITLIINSFHDYNRITGIVPGLTTKNYLKLWLDSYYLGIIGATFRLSGLTALIALLVGYPVGLYLTVASSRARGWVIAMVLSPLLVSVIVRTFGWAIIIGKNGLIERLFAAIGIPGADFLHTEGAVILGLEGVLLPFVVLSVATSLQAIDPAVPLAAASLGAGPFRVLWRVILPLSLPGIVSGTLIVFGLASATFVTPAVLGGAQFKVLSTLMYQQAMVLQNWPFAAAIAVTLTLIVLAGQMLQSKAAERSRYGAMLR